MRPFETLDNSITPGGQRLSLHHRDGDYFIDFDGHELMSTRVHDSETTLGKLACTTLGNIQQPRVLIGGLGLGFTLRAALDALPSHAEVIVAEVFPIIIKWHERYLKSLGVPLNDQRVRVHEGDVGDFLGFDNRNRYQAIVLDTDNGPDATCLHRTLPSMTISVSSGSSNLFSQAACWQFGRHTRTGSSASVCGDTASQ